MKHLTIILLISVGLLSCNREKHTYEDFGSKTIVCGEINNYLPDKHQNFIQLLNPDLILTTDYLIEIRKNGRFHFVFDKYFPIEVNLRYGSKHMFLYLQPGDSIFIELDAKEFNSPNDEDDMWSLYKFEKFKFSGKFNPAAYEILDFQPFYYENLYPILDFKIDDSLTQFENVERTIEDSLHFIEQLLNEYYTKKNSSEKFKNWSENYVTYQYLQKKINILLSEWNKGKVKSIPRSLNSEVKRNLNPVNDIYSIPYYLFLNRYKYKFCLIEEFGNIKNLYKKDKEKYYEALFSSLLNGENSVGEEILITETLIDLINENEKDEIYINNLYYQFINEIPHEFRNTISKIKSGISLSDSQLANDKIENDKIKSELINNIIERHRGKIIYIDFWATWCKACITEMQYLKELKREVDTNKVSLVYICMDSDETEWKNLREKHNLHGEHYLVNDKELEKIRKRFNIGSLPHYALIGAKSEVLSNNALRPSQIINKSSEYFDKFNLEN